MRSAAGGDFSAPIISAELHRQLLLVKPSHDGQLEYRPCSVGLQDGSRNDFVYVVEASAYIRVWGVWPHEDKTKSAIRIDEITRIEESPFRLPRALADRMYKQGESGMGYCIFTLVLKDGSRRPVLTGNAVDFPTQDVRTEEIKDLLPHVGRSEINRHYAQTGQHWPSVPYWWCLYRTADE
jgi:hypothetical protein